MKDYYTAGELAKLTGVSYKTIRYYLDKNLIQPEYVTDSGYRMYGVKTIETLQRIVLLKYLDFSLDSIKEIIRDEGFSHTFKKQEELLQTQKNHLEQVILAVKEIRKVNEEEKWDKMINIINMTARKEEVIKQYQKSDNLQKRINIHKYSTSNVSWYNWIFEKIGLKEGMKVLDIGCGNANFWIDVINKLPNGLKIYLTDKSEGMVNEARNKIEVNKEKFDSKNIIVKYKVIDAEFFEINENDFDIVLANHMLYHLYNERRQELFVKISNIMSDKGRFFASTIGEKHFKELFELLKSFDKRMEAPVWLCESFELENGKEQLEKVFKKVCMEEQDNNLLVSNYMAVYDYVVSLPGDISTIMRDKEKEFVKYLKNNISEENPYFISKSAGIFICEK